MPVYNGARWLGEAVRSIIEQSERQLELVIVDDGSTDQTRSLLCEMARKDRRIRVFRQDHAGLAAALNRGIAAARATYIARLDADDLAYPTRLERQAARLDQRPELGLIGAWAVEIDARGWRRGVRRPAEHDETLRETLNRGNPFIHSTIMARTSLLRELGGYRCAFRCAEDYDLWLRASEVAEIANIPEVLVGYRIHAGSVSRQDRLRQAFSVRLAQRAATVRRGTGADPAEALEAPPDWRENRAGTFYAETAELYRWLDPGCAAPRTPSHRGEEGLDWLSELNHDERRLAAVALLSRLRHADPSAHADARDLLVRLCRDRPASVLRAVWSLRV